MGFTAILGSTGTIGRTIARRLVAQGRPVLLVGRNPEKLQAVSVESALPSLLWESTDSSLLEESLLPMVQQHGGLAAIVNCIGSVVLKPAHSTSDEEFRKTVETNLFTAFAAVRVGAKLMKEQGGSIVLFASAAAEIGIQNH